MGAACRRGLSRGLESRVFTPAALLRALPHARPEPRTVLVDVDAEGFLCVGGGGGGGGERVATHARLAPHVHAAHLVVCVAGAEPAGAAGVLLRVRVERAAAPHDELLLWFDQQLLAALHLPYLTLCNIRGRKEYQCEECGARFEEPNPLKAHLFLRCAPVTPRRFWRLVAARLAPAPAAAAGTAVTTPEQASAFQRVIPASAEEAWAARLEAAAAEWGRARGPAGGHACLYCGKLYSRKYGLKIHLRTHTGYRPLRCRHCARAFGDPSNLNKHVRLHAAAAAAPGGRAAHACARCGKPLARRRDLERHLRAHCAPARAAST